MAGETIASHASVAHARSRPSGFVVLRPFRFQSTTACSSSWGPSSSAMRLSPASWVVGTSSSRWRYDAVFCRDWVTDTITNVTDPVTMRPKTAPPTGRKRPVAGDRRARRSPTEPPTRTAAEPASGRRREGSTLSPPPTTPHAQRLAVAAGDPGPDHLRASRRTPAGQTTSHMVGRLHRSPGFRDRDRADRRIVDVGRRRPDRP